jgi:trk system potassium uptake protein TrkA
MAWMKVIVIGIGEVGRHVAGSLSADRHDVTVIEQDPARVEASQQDLDALVIEGSGASPKLLREVGAADADLVCAVTQNDEANVIAALTAHQLGARQTIARVRDDDYYDDDQSQARDVLGIDVVIHPDEPRRRTSPRPSCCRAPSTSSTSPTGGSRSPRRSSPRARR